MKVIHNIKRCFSSMNYMKKLFFSYFLIICLILVIFSSASSYYSSKSETKQALYTAKNMLLQTTEFLGYKVTSIKNIINVISADETIQTLIASSDEFNRESQNNWIILSTTAKSIMYNANTSKDIHNIRLFALDGSISFENSKEFGQLTEEEKERWYERSSEKENISSLWLPASFFSSSDKLGAITYVKKIPDSKNLNQYLGTLTATINNSAFKDVIAQAATTLGTSVLLYNSYGETIMYHGKEDFFTPADVEALHLQAASDTDSELQQIKFNGKNHFIGIQPISGCDWTLAILTPSSDILRATRRYQQQTIILVILLIVLLIPVLYRTSKQLSSRIYVLKEYISRAVSSNFEIEPLCNGTDEIGVLTDSFNDMVRQISGLLKEQYKLGYEIKDLEFQVLQSQINPHFLYNTLDMISWMGYGASNEDICKVVASLSDFFRLSLNKGEDSFTLADELNHVKSYITIQEYRMRHIQFRLEAPRELLNLRVPKLMVQPLVENAILHGLRPRNYRGHITISCALEQAYLVIRVMDDGVGFDEKLLGERTEKSTSYGLKNIRQRLAVLYDDRGSLEIANRPEGGVVARLRYPAEKGAPAGGKGGAE